MGLFNFFKRKQTERNQKNNAIQPISDNEFLVQILKARLIELGYEVELHPQYLALIINSELEIATAIVDNPGAHPYVMEVMFLTAHPVYFPKGVIENLAGIGESLGEKMEAAVDNYLTAIFPTVMDGFTDTHDPEFDFYKNEILWHPKLSDLEVQGQRENLPPGDHLFNLIKEKVKPLLTDNKFNWLKIYVSKSAEGTIIGECVFNNQLWPEGTEAVIADAELWEVKGDFMALKQFVMFRRCDKYDPLPLV
ncbi:DUF6348 family protein [Mucilaginibacter celer]|uniref:Uncharacterized protein n=1 Tax=Mucilaginibacter celer TaxID=2305508 RepID=A0A494VPV5_9SPHI|nr:DUF6348 family protein [Mucilaginibacter celer]AYL96824.1 hypothetical protein HYN43_016615 [Mucilaginibacter celer]